MSYETNDVTWLGNPLELGPEHCLLDQLALTTIARAVFKQAEKAWEKRDKYEAQLAKLSLHDYGARTITLEKSTAARDAWHLLAGLSAELKRCAEEQGIAECEALVARYEAEQAEDQLPNPFYYVMYHRPGDKQPSGWAVYTNYGPDQANMLYAACDSYAAAQHLAAQLNHPVVAQPELDEHDPDDAFCTCANCW